MYVYVFMRKLFTYIGTGRFCPVLLRPAIDSSHEPSTIFRNMVLLPFQSLDSTLVNPLVKNVYNSIRLIGDILICIGFVYALWKIKLGVLWKQNTEPYKYKFTHFRTFLIWSDLIKSLLTEVLNSPLRCIPSFGRGWGLSIFWPLRTTRSITASWNTSAGDLKMRWELAWVLWDQHLPCVLATLRAQLKEDSSMSSEKLV